MHDRRSLCPVATTLALLFLGAAGCGSARDVPAGLGPLVHGKGILDPQNPTEWHGALLRDAGYQFSSCTVCHGEDFAGGQVGKSCLTCHEKGPTTCDTCHGSQLGAAHPAHVKGLSQGKKFDCSECHPTPLDYRDLGHLYESDGSVRTAPIRIAFGMLAGLSAPRGLRLPAPAWDAENRRCDNIYCHGAAFGDAGATNTQPSWIADASQAACGSCHGLPPKSHDPALVRCVLCHNRTVDALGQLRPGGLHLNGRVELGDGTSGCSACHGSATSPAPPTDISGNVDISAVGVGVHTSHLKATHRLRGPMQCSDCHVMPSRIDSPLHIVANQPAGVFPNTPLFVSMAQADGAQPSWDRQSARCSNVYCHGGGRKLLQDATPTLQRTPIWTQIGQAACGACHGIPPADAAHVSTMRLIDCVNCHPATMDASGTLLVTGFPGSETSAHINGVVDVR